jgi:hypothetical protein
MRELVDGKSQARKKPIEIVIIIRPNCLKVDKAIIFFKSHTKVGPRPAINIVNPETNNKIIFNHLLKLSFLLRAE